MEKFSKRRDELFLKLGKVALRKYEDALKRHAFFEEVIYRNYAKIKRTLYRVFTRNY